MRLFFILCLTVISYTAWSQTGGGGAGGGGADCSEDPEPALRQQIIDAGYTIISEGPDVAVSGETAEYIFEAEKGIPSYSRLYTNELFGDTFTFDVTALIEITIIERYLCDDTVDEWVNYEWNINEKYITETPVSGSSDTLTIETNHAQVTNTPSVPFSDAAPIFKQEYTGVVSHVQSGAYISLTFTNGYFQQYQLDFEPEPGRLGRVGGTVTRILGGIKPGTTSINQLRQQEYTFTGTGFSDPQQSQDFDYHETNNEDETVTFSGTDYENTLKEIFDEDGEFFWTDPIETWPTTRRTNEDKYKADEYKVFVDGIVPENSTFYSLKETYSSVDWDIDYQYIPLGASGTSIIRDTYMKAEESHNRIEVPNDTPGTPFEVYHMALFDDIQEEDNGSPGTWNIKITSEEYYRETFFNELNGDPDKLEVADISYTTPVSQPLPVDDFVDADWFIVTSGPHQGQLDVEVELKDNANPTCAEFDARMAVLRTFEDAEIDFSHVPGTSSARLISTPCIDN